MKKLSLFLIAIITITLSACSSSDEPVPPVEEPSKIINVTIDGVEKTFVVISVDKYNGFAGDGTPYTDIIVDATKTDEPTVSIHFELSSLVLGDDACFYFLYKKDGIEYDIEIDNSFNMNLSDNTENYIKGTFSGKLYGFDPANSATFANGNFSIKF